MKSIRKSSYSGLIQYMTSAQGKEERLGEIRITNCLSTEVHWATHEIHATQDQNQRALGDKTYHLLISFPSGEQPSSEIVRDIEDRVCASIGYKEHQRISVIHYDTDNFHIHVGINKIHPHRYSLHEPYRAYKKLADIAIKLELEHGLQKTNHIAKKVISENRAEDMEHHSGIESLLGWIKRECTEHLKTAQSWHEFHKILNNHGLELREQGNGFVIMDGSGIRVKASSVAREFSKPKLEQRYGIFKNTATSRQPQNIPVSTKPPIGAIGKKPPQRSQNYLYRIEMLEHLSLEHGSRYKPKPIDIKIDTVELFAQYQREQKNSSVARNKELLIARDKKNKLIETALRTGRLKRTAIKLLRCSKLNKKLLYVLVSKTLKKNIQDAKQHYLKESQAIFKKYNRYAWADWLKLKAQEGNIEALDALRARSSRKSLKGSFFSGQHHEKTFIQPEIISDNITKNGTIIYRVDSCAIRDDGDVLNISRGYSNKGVETALRMAINRFEGVLTVNGSAGFKEQVVHIAARLKLNMKFNDPALEKQRIHLIQTSYIKEEHYESRQQSLIKSRRTDRGSNENAGSIQFNKRRSGDRRTGNTGGIRSPSKPNIGRVGQQPPPASKNNLRNLSQLGMVQFSSRSEMLLSRHVPHHLEFQGTQSNHSLRRSVSGRVGSHYSLTSVEQYIAERDSKREIIADIPKHRIFNPDDQGTVQFAGIRQINDEFLVLLKREEQIIVLPINQTQLKKMKHISIDAPIKLTSKGILVFKGHRR